MFKKIVSVGSSSSASKHKRQTNKLTCFQWSIYDETFTTFVEIMQFWSPLPLFILFLKGVTLYHSTNLKSNVQRNTVEATVVSRIPNEVLSPKYDHFIWLCFPYSIRRFVKTPYIRKYNLIYMGKADMYIHSSFLHKYY